MRIVVDTNVFINALFHNDKYSREILKREHKGELSFVMSNDMAEELLITVLLHAKEMGCDLNDFEVPFLLLGRCLRRVEAFEPRIKIKVSEDPDDDMFAQCAIDANVKYIVSYDGHLRYIKKEIRNRKREIVEVLTPSEFINQHNLLKLQQKFNKAR